VCKKQNDCEINLKSRKSCQRCRFQKCLTVGMKPSWVLSEEEKKKRFRKTLQKKAEERASRERGGEQGRMEGEEDEEDEGDRDEAEPPLESPPPGWQPPPHLPPPPTLFASPSTTAAPRPPPPPFFSPGEPRDLTHGAQLLTAAAAVSAAGAPRPPFAPPFYVDPRDVPGHGHRYPIPAVPLAGPSSRFNAAGAYVGQPPPAAMMVAAAAAAFEGRPSEFARHHYPTATIRDVTDDDDMEEDDGRESASPASSHYSTSSSSTANSSAAIVTYRREPELPVTHDEWEQIHLIAEEHERQYRSVPFGEELIKEMVMCSVFAIPLSTSASMNAYKSMIQRITKVAQAFDPFLELDCGAQAKLLRTNADQLVIHSIIALFLTHLPPFRR